MRKIASLNFLLTVAFVEATPAPISIEDLIISARTENEKDYYSRYSKRLEKSKFQVDQPVIGILTMPFWKADMKPDSFPYT